MTISVRPLTGRDLAAALPAVARLWISVFRARPYLYDGSLACEEKNHSSSGRSWPWTYQLAREPQCTCRSGLLTGSSSSAPAGMMTSRPLRVAWGSGEPHRRQKDVAKLRAVGRSKRETCSSPKSHRKALTLTAAFDA